MWAIRLNQQRFTDTQFLELYKKGLSDQAIADILKVHRVTVRQRRVNKFHLPANDPIKNIVTSKSLTKEGAYVIGALLGDKANIWCGFVPKENKWRYEVSLSAGLDYEFGVEWLKNLDIAIGRRIGFMCKPKGRCWIAMAVSKRAYLYVTQFIDPHWKSNSWHVPDDVWTSKEDVIESFCRGLYDAEASVQSYYVPLTIKNITALSELKELLKQLGINSYIFQHRTRVGFATLVISREANLRLFAEKIGFGIRRKQKALERMIKGKKWWRHEGRSKEILHIAEKYRNGFTSAAIAHDLGIPRRLVSYSLKFLKRKGAVVFVGDTKWGKWYLKQNERWCSEASIYAEN